MTQIIVRNLIHAAPFLLAISLARAESIPTTAVPAVIVNTSNEPVAAGKFSPTWESLKQYQTPEWFRDTKFGIWACFGPQCEAEDGDWYGRGMYDVGCAQNKFHIARFGPPEKFGFKDLARAWHAENWDPEKLVALYKRAGAQYFFAMVNHHDNFDCWDSKYEPWNSVNIGPQKDLVAGWAKAARHNGLRFGVSVHASHAWTWFELAQNFDGKLTKADGKGLWWDGLDPQDLYAQNHAIGAESDADYTTKFFNRIKDVIDSYHPDLIFFDDTKLPIGDMGLNLAAHFYNANQKWHGGNLQAVIVSNGNSVVEQQAITNNLERNMTLDLLRLPWNKGSTVGPWHYSIADYNKGYAKSATWIHLLVDVVRKNGTLLLSFPLPGHGKLDDKAIAVLDDMTAWMAVNSECIYDARPWTIYGEVPTVKNDATARETAGNPPRGLGPALTASDIRFTTKGDVLYAVVMGKPDGGKANIKSLATNSPHYQGEIGSVQLLGSSGNLEITRDENGLSVTLPTQRTKSDEFGIALKTIPKA